MTRLRSLIKEILSSPKKKNCGCGCNKCGDKAPILTEGKFKSLISEGLQHHIDKKISLFESVYRIGSDKHLGLIREARALWIRGIIEVSDDDKGLLETHLGHFGLYEGVEVPLDLPMLNEEKGRAREIMKDLFGLDFEFDYTYKPEGDKIIIHPEGYNPDGTLFDMKDVHKEKIIRTFRDKMPNTDAKPNMGGGITVHLKESLNEEKKYFGVFQKGGSIGQGKDEPLHSFVDKEEAKQKAKRLRQTLTPGEKSYYRMGYIVRPTNVAPESLNEEMGEWPKELTSRYSDEYRFELEKVSPTYQDKPGRAKYRVIDIESGELKGTPVFEKPESLMAFADDLIKPQGGTQSTNLGESLEERIGRILESTRQELGMSSSVSKSRAKAALNNPSNDGSKVYGLDKNGKQVELKSINDIDKFKKFEIDADLNEAKKKKEKKDPPLNKPKRGGSKAYYVYVRDPKTKKSKKYHLVQVV